MRSLAMTTQVLAAALTTACGDAKPDAEETGAATTGASSSGPGTSSSSGAPTGGATTGDSSGEPPTGGPPSDCDLHKYITTWAGAGAKDCGELGVDASAEQFVQLHDCVLAQVAADLPFVAAGGDGVFAGRAEPEPKLSRWDFNGAGYVGIGCANITAVADCTPTTGKTCLQCEGPTPAIDNYCVAM